MGRKVFKAVIPAAGRGMRMRPISLVLPKEMMPLGRKPMIQAAVEEAASAGIREVCIVIRKGKEITKDHLLHRALQSPGGVAGTRRRSCKLTFVYQRSWDGLGGALRAARRFVGQDPFLMIIPDQFLIAQRFSASQQLLSQYEFEPPVVLSSMVEIPKREAVYFHGSRGFVIDADVRRTLVRRPLPITRLGSEAETRKAFRRLPYEVRGFGRTIFPAAIFPYLSRRFVNHGSGEIDLGKTFKEFPNRIPHFGSLLAGRACDVGTFDGYYHYLPFFLDD